MRFLANDFLFSNSRQINHFHKSIQFLNIFKHSFSYGERVKINKMPPSYDLLINMSPGHPSLRSPSRSPVLCVEMYFLENMILSGEGEMFVNENDFSKKSDESRANLNDMLFGCHCIRLSIKYSDVDILIIRTTTEPRQTHRKSNRCMARHSLIHQRVAQTHRHSKTHHPHLIGLNCHWAHAHTCSNQTLRMRQAQWYRWNR